MINLSRVASRLLALLLVVSLSACSTVKGWFDSDDEDPTAPVELVDIETSIKIKKLWSTGIGKGQGKGLYSIQPVLQGEKIYAASADGEVYSIDRRTGKRVMTGWPSGDSNAAIIWEAFKPDTEPDPWNRRDELKAKRDEILAAIRKSREAGPRQAASSTESEEQENFAEEQGGIY